jgi:SAM-dependent methyltransferase
MDDGVLESCACPLCGSSTVAGDSYDFSPYFVRRCAECGLWYLNPRMREDHVIKLYADDSYFEGSDGVSRGYSNYASQEATLRKTFARFLRELKNRGMTGGDLLEVGCGYGYLLAEARPCFRYLAATDYSKEALKHARRHADEVFLGGMDALPEGMTFDCIIASEVIEHVYSPNDFVRQAVRRLNEDGWLVLAAPDMGSWWRRLLGRKWPSFKIPEHVTYYDRGTMGALLERNGLIDITPLRVFHMFPVGVILEKIGLPAPRFLAGKGVWLPDVVFAMAGRRGRA